MGTQSNDRGGENRQSQSQPGKTGSNEQTQRQQGQKQGQGDPQRKPGGENRPQQQGGRDPAERGNERLASDDDAGGEPDADGELSQPGQSGNQDRERSGSTRSRNP